MKYCPICERNYDDRVQVCEMDGATLRLVGQKQDPYIGKILKGRYNVISKIGQGGMGAVYLADQVSVGRKVALKLLQHRNGL
jgi:serine/threonine protein kinase